MSGKKKTCFRFIHSSSTLDGDQETINPREAKKEKKKNKKAKLEASPVYFKADKSELQKYSAATATRVAV